MARRTKNPENKRILEEMAKQEYGHYLFWKRYSGEVKLSSGDRIILKLLILVSKLMGTVFTVKFLERHESEVVEEYKRVLEERSIKEEDLETLKKIIEEEEVHENYFISQIDEFAIRHLGSIALGMADAIIELTGVHVGFIGFSGSSIVTGIAGLIVGISASMSMAAASYLQAKQEKGKQPILSALTTGLAYILTVITLASPFFTIPSILYAFILSSMLAFSILGFFSYYSSVIFDRKFLRDYLENVLLIMLIVVVGYFFGDFVKTFFGFKLPEI